VRGPTHVVKKGKTPVLLGDEARTLLDSIDVTTIIGLRDRALIALLIYSFARISAALQMNVDDYYPQGKRWWVRLHEKGGKQHEMPAHHLLEHYLDAYVTAAGLAGEKASPLFRTLGGRGRKQLTGWYREVAVKSMDSHAIRAVLVARAQLVTQKVKLSRSRHYTLLVAEQRPYRLGRLCPRRRRRTV